MVLYSQLLSPSELLLSREPGSFLQELLSFQQVPVSSPKVLPVPLNNSEIEEKDITLKIVNAMEEDLTARGAKVYVTRRTDDTVGIYYRMAEVHLICMDIAKERGILPFSAEKEADLRAKCEKIKEINEWQKFSQNGMGFMAGFGASDDLKLLMDLEAQLTDVVFVSIHINSTGDPAEYEIKHGAAVHYADDKYISSPSHDEGGEPR